MRTFKDLDAWKVGIELTTMIYALCRQLPEEEKYGLSSQMKRSAVSIPSNIAEGFRRNHRTEFKHFLAIALGSLAELETQVIIATELGYVNVSPELEDKLDHMGRLITALKNSLGS